MSISTRRGTRESTALRPARAEDRPFVVSLAGAFAPFGPYRQIVGHWFEDRFVRVFVLEEGGERVGFFMLGPWFPWWLRRTVELMAIAVVPERRGQGLGRIMVGEAQRLAREAGYRWLRAHVGCENTPALALFQKCGFRLKKRIESYYPSGLAAYELVAPV